jgi:hypothetical protein
MDMSITVGWNTAKKAGISRAEMDAPARHRRDRCGEVRRRDRADEGAAIRRLGDRLRG